MKLPVLSQTSNILVVYEIKSSVYGQFRLGCSLHAPRRAQSPQLRHEYQHSPRTASSDGATASPQTLVTQTTAISINTVIVLSCAKGNKGAFVRARMHV